jgi:hypothetical protein
MCIEWLINFLALAGRNVLKYMNTINVDTFMN